MTKVLLMVHIEANKIHVNIIPVVQLLTFVSASRDREQHGRVVGQLKA